MNLLAGIIGAMPGAASQGVLWGIMTLGVYITYKVLDYADLTVDGSFATGGAVTAVLIINGMNPTLSLFFAIVAGFGAGLITGVLHTKLQIPAILSGILSQLALYSINIMIMSKANTPLLGVETVVTQAKKIVPMLSDNTITLMLGTVAAAVIIAVLYWLFGTELGCCVRATGNNEYMVRALGGNTDAMKILGLMLSNALVALSGALVAQTQGYADVGMGIGAIVIGLASVIIGEVLMGKRFSFAYKLVSVVIGSVVYRVIIAVVLQLGMKSTNLKLLTAVIVAIALSVPVIKNKLLLFKNTRRLPSVK
ncbi:MAG: ABC transporter permease [Hydrogenoanaerobacterium sp.]